MGASQTKEAERIDGPIEPAPAPLTTNSHALVASRDVPGQPTVFRWEGEGDRVYLVGSFDGWTQKIPLKKSAGDLTAILNLPKGEYQYKFVVDEEYKVSQSEPMAKAKDGTLVNVIKVDDVVSTEPKGHGLLSSSPPSSYAQEPPRDNFAKEPPLLPRHLHYPLLNCAPTTTANDLSLLPIPPHVCIGRAYWTKGSKNPSGNYGAILFSTTQRYRQKYVTTIVYTPPSTQLSVAKSDVQSTPQAESRGRPFNVGEAERKGVRFGSVEGRSKGVSFA